MSTSPRLAPATPESEYERAVGPRGQRTQRRARRERIGLDRRRAQFQMREHDSPAATDRRRDVIVAIRPERRRQELEAHPALDVAADREHAAVLGLHVDDDVAMRAHADTEIPAALGDRAIRAPPRAADEITGLERQLADVVRNIRGRGIRIVARFDCLIDIDVMRDVTPEPLVTAEAALAHDPRDERGRPRIAPPRTDPFRAVPVLVLPRDYPASVARRGPVTRDRSGDTGRLRRIEPHEARWKSAAPAIPIIVVDQCLVDDVKAEVPPFLHGNVENPPSQVRLVGAPARRHGDPHRAGLAVDALGRRCNRKLRSRKPLERQRLRRKIRNEREPREHRGDEHSERRGSRAHCASIYQTRTAFPMQRRPRTPDRGPVPVRQ